MITKALFSELLYDSQSERWTEFELPKLSLGELLDQTRSFSVFEQEKITLAIGDRIRFTKNVKHRGQKFVNNELRTVVSIDEGKIIFDKGAMVRNGAALHLDQGIVVTSHASQAKTVDQVIASVPVRAFSQANEAQFYVSMSRARWARAIPRPSPTLTTTGHLNHR